MIEVVGNEGGLHQQAARSAARPEASLRESEWADHNRILITRSFPEPGPLAHGSHS